MLRRLHVGVEAAAGGRGPIYTYRFLDRRWKWQYGDISGHYNQRDKRDNLIPWTVQSPEELAKLCLKAMGETKYEIDLPDGVSGFDLDQYRDNPAPGEKTPVTKTNPEVFWEGERPAIALDRLCALFGRRLLWDYATNTVRIAKPGYGGNLPMMPHLNEVRNHLDQAAKPKGVGVIGAPVRVQMRLKLIPVGEEWDGRFLPIDQLSYRPVGSNQPGIWSITFAGPGPDYTGTITINGIEHTVGPLPSAAEAAAAMAALLNGLTLGGQTAQAEVSGDGVRLTIPAGETVPVMAASAGAEMNLTQMPLTGAWQSTSPDAMFNVRATDRLTYQEARQLAQKTVYRYFRVADDDVSCGWAPDRKSKPIDVPRYGRITRRQQLMLEPSMVLQVNPSPREDDRVQSGTGASFLIANPDYYNGFSRDRKPQVFGQVSFLCNGDFFLNQRMLNTPENRRVAGAFTIDQQNQLVIFGRPQYIATQVPGPKPGTHMRIDSPKLTLETGVLVRDNENGAPIRYRRWFKFEDQKPSDEPTGNSDGEDATTVVVKPTEYTLNNTLPESFTLKKVQDNNDDLKAGMPQTPAERNALLGIEWFKHDDVPLAVIGVYDYDPVTKGYTLAKTVDETDDASRPRADYYLGGHMLEHLVKGGQTAVYHGIHSIPLDGAITQVTLEVGNGAKTYASRNAEHAVWLPPLPLRRRNEALAADERARSQNLAESNDRGAVLSPEEAKRRTALMAEAGRVLQ